MGEVGGKESNAPPESPGSPTAPSGRPTGSRLVTFGVIAQGRIAVGVVAIGGVSIGIVALGGVAIGLIALGGLAVGGLALGGIAVGWRAIGAVAFGLAAAQGAAKLLLAVACPGLPGRLKRPTGRPRAPRPSG